MNETTGSGSTLSRIPARIGAGIREFFTLREATARAQATPEDVRTETARALTRAWQKRDAAETLWPRGSLAIAIRLALEGFDEASNTVTRLALAHPDDRDGLARAARIVAAVRPQAEGAKPPELDDDAQPEHGVLVRTLLDASYDLERATAPLVTSPGDITRLRRHRRAWLVGLGAVLLAVLVLWAKSARATKAEASAVYAPTFAAANAIDGRPETEWLLPDRVPGWLDVRFPRRAVGVVRIRNAHNPPHNDRGSQTIRVTAYDGATQVKSVDASFGAIGEPQPIEVSVGVGRCDRLQIEILTSFKSGGGLAEVEIP